MNKQRENIRKEDCTEGKTPDGVKIEEREMKGKRELE